MRFKRPTTKYWKPVVDFTKFKKGGIAIEKLLSVLAIERRSEKTYKF